MGGPGMTRDELIAWASQRGWKPDRYGHLQKTEPDGRVYRLKISRVAARYEIRVGNLGWTRIQSGYLKKLSIAEDGRLAGLTR